MFAKNLKKLREEKDLSQADLAKEFNVAQQTIGKWEKGITRPRQQMLEKIADFFHVSTDYLLGRDGNQPYESDIARILLQPESEEGKNKPNRTIEMLRTYAELPPDKKSCAREYIAFLSNTCQNKQPIQQDK